jgi:hypothetical protein
LQSNDDYEITPASKISVIMVDLPTAFLGATTADRGFLLLIDGQMVTSFGLFADHARRCFRFTGIKVSYATPPPPGNYSGFGQRHGSTSSPGLMEYGKNLQRARDLSTARAGSLEIPRCPAIGLSLATTAALKFFIDLVVGISLATLHVEPTWENGPGISFCDVICDVTLGC